MPKAARGLTALIDGPHLPKCVACGAVDPDPTSLGYCQKCGAVLGERLTRRLLALQRLVLAGTVLCLAGGAAALWGRWQVYVWGGLASAVVSAAFVGYAAVVLRRTSLAVQAAARMRGGNELIYYWTQVDRGSVMLLMFFAGMLAAMMPYVWFVHAPRFIRVSTNAAFDGRLQEYVDLAAKNSGPIIGPPRRKFKLVVIDQDADGPRISPIHFLLSPEIRASTPDEVGTVALMRYKDVRTPNNYQPGDQPAYERVGELTLINLVKKSVLERLTFRGGPPPTKVPSGSAGYGPRPTHTVASHLKTLPTE